MVASFTVLPMPTLAIEPENQNVEAVAGTTTFTVFSNTAWTMESDAKWCSTQPAGDGNGVIEVNYTANPINDVKMATLTVSVSSLDPISVTVTQATSGDSVAEVELPGFSIYPNPSSGRITISLDKFNNKEIVLSVIKTTGQILIEKAITANESHTLDLFNFAAGSYILIIDADNQRLSQRLVIAD